MHSNKKKKPTVKLTLVGAILLGIYATFVYLILVTFGEDSSLSSSPGEYSGADGGLEVATGMQIDGANLLHRDEDTAISQVFDTDKVDQISEKSDKNSNSVINNNNDNKFSNNNTPQHKPSKTKEEEELEYILTGKILNHASEVKVTKDSIPQGVMQNEEHGIRDRRTAKDIVASVLAAAEFGDRQYDDEESDGQVSSITMSQTVIEGGRTPQMPILTAYCEPVNQTTWSIKPLPRRYNTQSSSQPQSSEAESQSNLFSIQYPHLTSCKALPSQFPIDTPPVDLDPFLPWIHDVFPSSDGKYIQFVAQNRRRCFNGQRRVYNGERLPQGVVAHKNYVHLEYGKNYFMRPQAALFQHVPVKKVEVSDEHDDDSSNHEKIASTVGEEPRYRLASHEDADPDGMDTRFICRFKSFDPDATTLTIVGYSLSEFELDYDFHTYRKGYLHTATHEGYDNHMIWMSQLLFKCPIPEDWRDKVKLGDTVINDYSTLYVDIIPIRTPPRYTPPREFFQPKYRNSKMTLENLFLPDDEWGKDHILPKIDHSGRWENIPICMPSLMTHGLLPKGSDIRSHSLPDHTDNHVAFPPDETPSVIHEVIACTWASTTFKTRSNRAQVGDGKRRLKEWLEFNLLSGFNHIYVYDNSGAFTNRDSLADVIDLFPPEQVTRIDWPCKICSNRDGNEGERSSQYAAESSCRMRFGAHARWLGSFDTDEYLVPMGKFGSMSEVAADLDRRRVRVAVFPSSPAKPRFDLIDDPEKTKQPDGTFIPTVKDDETFLHTYNCNWEQFPRTKTLTHRSKQMYRADYVKLHYVHYATVTVVSQMNEKETKDAGERWTHRYKESHMLEFDEENEATMLHSKSKVATKMRSWKERCTQTVLEESHCNVGFPFPKDYKDGQSKNRSDGWAYNCFLNDKIESYWWPKLVDAIKKREEITASLQ